MTPEPPPPPDGKSVDSTKARLAATALKRVPMKNRVRLARGLFGKALDQADRNRDGSRPTPTQVQEARRRTEEAQQEQQDNERRLELASQEFYGMLTATGAGIGSIDNAWEHSDTGARRDPETVRLLAENNIVDDNTLAQWLVARARDRFRVRIRDADVLMFSIYFTGSTRVHVSGTMVRGVTVTGNRVTVSHIGPGGLY